MKYFNTYILNINHLVFQWKLIFKETIIIFTKWIFLTFKIMTPTENKKTNLKNYHNDELINCIQIKINIILIAK